MWLFLIKMSSTISFQQWSELKTSFLSQAEQNLHLHFLYSKLLPEISQLKQIPHAPTLLSLSWRQTFRGFASFHFQPEKNISKPWKPVKMGTSVYYYCSFHPPAQSSEMTSISLDSCGLFFLIFLMGMLLIIPTIPYSSFVLLSTVKYPQLILLIAASDWPHTYFLTTHLCSTGSKCLPLL